MSTGTHSWNGLRIHVEDHGVGPALLLINGLGGNTAMWKPLIDRLGSRRVISFDAPGTGRSGTPFWPIAIPGLADLAGAVLDFCNIARADVLGYSYGGAVAQQLAHDHPSRVRRLVLAATSCGIGAVPGSFRAMQVLSTPFRYYSRTYFERTARMTYGGRTGRNATVRRQMMSSRRKLPPTSYGYAMQLLGGSSWSSLPFLRGIPHEALVISGDDDPLIPVANAKLLARRIARGRLDIVEAAGHLFLWDDAGRVGGRIAVFLDEPERGESVEGTGYQTEPQALRVAG